MPGLELRVWAPRARRVELCLADRRVPLAARADGEHVLAAAPLAHGEDYAFSLDGAEPLPDPRSRWQPHGVLGWSRRYEHDRFRWRSEGFRAPPWGGGLLYELHVGTFTPGGTFDAAIERLDHLVDLGVSHVELMPVHAFSGRHGWGYDGAQWFAPHEPYGGPDGLKRLIDACHQRGLAVLIDVVYNHLGPVGNHLARFGPYFTDGHQTPWGDALNYDAAGSECVRAMVLENVRSWLVDYRADGLRLDAVHAIRDDSALHLLEAIGIEVDRLRVALGRELVVVAESDRNDPRPVRSREAHGFGLDAVWLDDFHHAMHAYLTGERERYYADFGGLDPVVRSLREAFVVAGTRSPFRGALHGRPAGALPGRRFVAYLQNHDQVGNRRTGDRLGHGVDHGRLRVAAAVLAASPFVPLWFQGEEWAASAPFAYFTDHEDAELGEAVREGRAREFCLEPGPDVPDPQDEATFQRSKLDWDELRREPHARMLAWYRALARLRRGSEDLLRDDRAAIGVDGSAAEDWLVVRRGRLVLLANFADGDRRLPLPGDGAAGWHEVLSSWRAGDAGEPPRVEGDAVLLPPRSAVFYGWAGGVAGRS